MTDYEIERDITINAPIAIVWQTIADPQKITAWFSDAAEFTAMPGNRGTLTFNANTEPHVVPITIVDADEPHRFSYRWVYPPDQEASTANSTLVTFTLTATDHETTHLRVVETGLEQMVLPDAEKDSFADQHRAGWQTQGDRLRALFAAQPE